MKNFLYHSGLIFFITIFAISCSSDNGSNGDEGLPSDPSDFPLEAINAGEVDVMFLSAEEYEGELESFLTILLRESPQNISVSINGNDIALEGFMGMFFGEVDLLPGQEVNYELVINGNSRSGTLVLPGLVRATFPDEFDLSSNYSVSWSLEQDPAMFIAFLGIELDEDYVESLQMLEGSQRNHTFSSDIYSGIDAEQIWYIDVGVSAGVFEINDNMVIFASTEDYKEYYFEQDHFWSRDVRKQDRLPGIKGRLPMLAPLP